MGSIPTREPLLNLINNIIEHVLGNPRVVKRNPKVFPKILHDRKTKKIRNPDHISMPHILGEIHQSLVDINFSFWTITISIQDCRNNPSLFNRSFSQQKEIIRKEKMRKRDTITSQIDWFPLSSSNNIINFMAKALDLGFYYLDILIFFIFN